MGDLVAVADAYFAAVRAHDAAAVAAVFAEDAELVTPAGTYRGPAAIAEFYRAGAFAFDDLEPAPGEYLISGDRLAVEIELRMAGKVTRVADVFTVEGDRIRRLAVYMGPDAAVVSREEPR